MLLWEIMWIFLVIMKIYLFYLGFSNCVKDTHFPKYPLICMK